MGNVQFRLKYSVKLGLFVNGKSVQEMSGSECRKSNICVPILLYEVLY